MEYRSQAKHYEDFYRSRGNKHLRLNSPQDNTQPEWFHFFRVKQILLERNDEWFEISAIDFEDESSWENGKVYD